MNINVKSIGLRYLCKKCDNATKYIGEVVVYDENLHQHRCESCGTIYLLETKYTELQNIKSIDIK